MARVLTYLNVRSCRSEGGLPDSLRSDSAKFSTRIAARLEGGHVNVSVAFGCRKAATT